LQHIDFKKSSTFGLNFPDAGLYMSNPFIPVVPCRWFTVAGALSVALGVSVGSPQPSQAIPGLTY